MLLLHKYLSNLMKEKNAILEILKSNIVSIFLGRKSHHEIKLLTDTSPSVNHVDPLKVSAVENFIFTLQLSKHWLQVNHLISR